MTRSPAVSTLVGAPASGPASHMARVPYVVTAARMARAITGLASRKSDGLTRVAITTTEDTAANHHRHEPCANDVNADEKRGNPISPRDQPTRSLVRVYSGIGRLRHVPPAFFSYSSWWRKPAADGIGLHRGGIALVMTAKTGSATGESIHAIELKTLHGESASLAEHKGKVVLAVNVASRCGLTPHYTGLQAVHEKYVEQGFTVIGFPCNQFAGQEPGTAEEISEFCSVNFGVTFPLYEKLDVKGDGQHPVYRILAAAPYDDGEPGDVLWNFEKFLVDKDGRVVRRFKPTTTADDPAVIEAIEQLL